MFYVAIVYSSKCFNPTIVEKFRTLENAKAYVEIMKKESDDNFVVLHSVE